MDTHQIAEAFSRHRFADVYDSLAEGIKWVSPGQGEIAGKADVVKACQDSLIHFRKLDRVEFTRFVSVGGETVAAVDAVVRYVATDGTTSVVSSADIYKFDDLRMLVTITSYAVELAG